MIKKIISAVISILIAYASIRLALWLLGIIWNMALFAAVIVLAAVIYFAINKMLGRNK